MKDGLGFDPIVCHDPIVCYDLLLSSLLELNPIDSMAAEENEQLVFVSGPLEHQRLTGSSHWEE